MRSMAASPPPPLASRLGAPRAILVGLLAGCHSVGQPAVDKGASAAGDSSSAVIEAGVARADRDADARPDAEAGPELPWGTRARGPGPLYPIVDGMCIHGQVFRLENGAIFAYGMTQGPWSRGGATTAQIVGDEGLTPVADGGLGSAFDFWAPRAIGGTAPDKLWAIVDVSSRMVSASDFYTSGSKGSDWKLVLPSGAKFGDAGNMRTGSTPVLSLHAAGAYGPGRFLFAERADAVSERGEPSGRWSFRVLGEDGAWVRDAKVPGADLAQLATGNAFARLANGEVLGVADGQGATTLVRWSPTKAVRDLPLPAPSRGSVKLAAGSARAILELDGALFVYDGETLAPSKLNPRLSPGFSWAIAPDDTLYVVLPTKTWLEEKRGGEIHEEALPATGTLVGVDRGAFWIVAPGKGDRGSDALFRRDHGVWEPVPLPEPPFGNELRGPLHVEGVTAAAPDDVYVNVRRVEKGYGWKAPEPFRAIYRTKRPREVMRCRDTRDNGSTGRGLHPWPPAADATCKTPVVVLLADTTPKPPKDYPSLRAKLRGKQELGDTITFVSFDARGTSNLAALAPTVEKARALATFASKALDLRAEVVCGVPTPTRTFTYDVAKGTFAF
ncbi:MAG: hypothetical protein JNM74_18120 [Myxococcales bacterium]|nr:hypothetical protein [Myxococcales bacterium]